MRVANYLKISVRYFVVLIILFSTGCGKKGGDMSQDNSGNENIKNMDNFYKSDKFKKILGRIVEAKQKQLAEEGIETENLSEEQKETMVNKIHDSINNGQGKIDIANKLKEVEKIQSAPIGTAAWLGTTGLGIDTENELISYLRRELGAGLWGSKTIEANDLNYIGAFIEGTNRVHYWKVNWVNYKNEEVYATVLTDTLGNGGAMSVGGSKPPK